MYHIESVPPKLHLLTKTSVVQCNVVLQVVMCGFAAKLKKYVLYMQCPKLYHGLSSGTKTWMCSSEGWSAPSLSCG